MLVGSARRFEADRRHASSFAAIFLADLGPPHSSIGLNPRGPGSWALSLVEGIVLGFVEVDLEAKGLPRTYHGVCEHLDLVAFRSLK
jgi:hypothetical protein